MIISRERFERFKLLYLLLLIPIPAISWIFVIITFSEYILNGLKYKKNFQDVIFKSVKLALPIFIAFAVSMIIITSITSKKVNNIFIY